MIDNFDKAWKKLLKARYMSDISSEESDIEKVKRKERARKMTNTDFISFDDENDEIPLPPKLNISATLERVNPAKVQKVRHTNIV